MDGDSLTKGQLCSSLDGVERPTVVARYLMDVYNKETIVIYKSPINLLTVTFAKR